MADSKFWRDKAAEFRRLDPFTYVRLEWKKFKSQSDYEYWVKVDKPEHDSVKARYLSLATQCGTAMANKRTPSALALWINLIVRTSKNEHHLAGCESYRDGPREDWIGGRIVRLCESSAVFCNMFERAEVERENRQSVQRESAPLFNLRAMGLDMEISDSTAAKLWATLLIIDGRANQGFYNKSALPDGLIVQHLYDAYHAIAESIIGVDPTDEFLDVKIPDMGKRPATTVLN